MRLALIHTLTPLLIALCSLLVACGLTRWVPAVVTVAVLLDSFSSYDARRLRRSQAVVVKLNQALLEWEKHVLSTSSGLPKLLSDTWRRDASIVAATEGLVAAVEAAVISHHHREVRARRGAGSNPTAEPNWCFEWSKGESSHSSGGGWGALSRCRYRGRRTEASWWLGSCSPRVCGWRNRQGIKRISGRWNQSHSHPCRSKDRPSRARKEPGEARWRSSSARGSSVPVSTTALPARHRITPPPTNRSSCERFKSKFNY
jgi:hypothetical protein